LGTPEKTTYIHIYTHIHIHTYAYTQDIALRIAEALDSLKLLNEEGYTVCLPRLTDTYTAIAHSAEAETIYARIRDALPVFAAQVKEKEFVGHADEYASGEYDVVKKLEEMCADAYLAGLNRIKELVKIVPKWAESVLARVEKDVAHAVAQIKDAVCVYVCVYVCMRVCAY
jgi:hypothetical protein